MASGKTNYAEGKVLDHMLGVATWGAVTAYIALFTVAPSDAGGGTEVTGGSYARVAAASKFATAGGVGTSANTAEVAFAEATASWGTVVAFALFDASSGGNMLSYGDLTTSRTIGTGVVARFPIGTLVFNED